MDEQYDFEKEVANFEEEPVKVEKLTIFGEVMKEIPEFGYTEKVVTDEDGKQWLRINWDK